MVGGVVLAASKTMKVPIPQFETGELSTISSSVRRVKQRVVPRVKQRVSQNAARGLAAEQRYWPRSGAPRRMCAVARRYEVSSAASSSRPPFAAGQHPTIAVAERNQHQPNAAPVKWTGRPGASHDEG